MVDLILASNSPRRKEMLHHAGFDFRVEKLEVEEVVFPEWSALEVAEKLAVLKNEAYREVFEKEVIITADTVVIDKEQVLGKPSDRQEAIDMIQSMQGEVHQVVSAICISSPEKMKSISDLVEVKMTAITIEEIEFYVDKYRPFDKAGAYGIQEWIGMIGVEAIKGSYYSVVGMPIHLVYKILKEEFGISPQL